MKLHEIKINEGRVEPNLMLSIRNIMLKGKVDNHFEFMIITRVLQMLKNGTFWNTSNVMDSNLSTSKVLIDYLRALPQIDILFIVTKIWDLLQLKDQDLSYYNPEQDSLDWIKLFTAREAND